MAGFNVQTYLENFIAAASLREINRTSADNISDTEILRRLNTAQTFIADKYKPSAVRRTQDMVSGQQNVLFPWGRLNGSITQVWALREDGTQYLLERISEDQMESLYPVGDTTDDSNQSGPLFWCFADAFNPRNRIRIRPVPTVSITDGIIFRYPSFPNQLFRVENVAVTQRAADFTAESEFVYIYGVSGTGRITFRTGDEIGVCYDTNLDGSSTSDSTVRVWYGVVDADIPNGSSTLTDIVTNGTFTGSASGWTTGGGAAYNSNNVTFTGAGTLTQTLTDAYLNNWYRVDFTLSSASSPSLTPTYNALPIYNADGTALSAITSNGAKFGYFQATTASADIVFTNTTGNVTIDGVAVKACSRIELERVFDQPSVAGAKYIAAQVPDAEYSVPGGVGNAIVHLALADYFEDYNQPAKAQRFRTLAVDRMSLYNKDETDSQYGRYNPYFGLEGVTNTTTISYWADGSPGGYVPYYYRGILPGDPTLL